MKITEAMRKRKALEMIEEISSDAQSTNGKRDWKQSEDAVLAIYRIAHTICAPRCRKNHAGWVKKIDSDLAGTRKGKKPMINDPRKMRRKFGRRQDRKKLRTGSVPGGRYSYRAARSQALSDYSAGGSRP